MIASLQKPFLLKASVLAVTLVCGLLGGPVSGADEAFVVHELTSEEVEGVIKLDATIEYRLSDALLDALRNGVELVIEVRIEVSREREWWLNAEVASLVQRYQLGYHALSQQYLLKNLNTGVQLTFPSLTSTLHAMGTIQDFPMLDASLLQPGIGYEARLRARLAVDELPLPLRARAYMSGDWRPASDWYTWALP